MTLDSGGPGWGLKDFYSELRIDHAIMNQTYSTTLILRNSKPVARRYVPAQMRRLRPPAQYTRLSNSLFVLFLMTDHSQPMRVTSCGKVWKARSGYDHNLDSRHFSRCCQKTHGYSCYPRQSLFMAMVATLRDDREVSFRRVRELWNDQKRTYCCDSQASYTLPNCQYCQT